MLEYYKATLAFLTPLNQLFYAQMAPTQLCNQG